MAISPQHSISDPGALLAYPDYATTARWQHKLASRIIIQAFKDLRNRQGPAEYRLSAREFLAGSAMLRYWCLVGSLDLQRITRLARRGSSPPD